MGETQETKNTSDASATAVPDTAPKAPAEKITPEKMNALLGVLKGLLDHTHIFYDDYGTACNCNCTCNCTRGTL